MVQKTARGWLTIPGALSIAAGLAVLAALIWKIGVDDIREGILRVGWAFPVIVALGGVRFLVRAYAWALCVERPHALRIHEAVAAVLAGDALSNATPLGPVVGEPAKVAFARAHLPAAAGATALAVENLFYTLSTAAVIAAGMVALLLTVSLPARVREYSEIAVIAIGAALLLVALLYRARPAVLSRWVPLVARSGGRLHGTQAKLQAIEEDVYSFASRRSGTLVPLVLLEAAFHALAVLETHVTLWMILGDAPPLITSFIMETAGRLITVLFKFVPLQIGVAQGGLAMTGELIGLGATAGLTFSLVRAVRVAVWAVAGACLLLRRGITPRMVLADVNLRADTR